MRLPKSGRNVLPQLVKQLSLNNFFPTLPTLPATSVASRITVQSHTTGELKYTIEISADNVVDIRETHCKICSQRIVKNGYNNRVCILDQGEGRFYFRLHRKRCPKCGEIKMDLSAITRPHGQYHENYLRRTRQYYMNGLMPSQIQQVFLIDHNQFISKSTLVRWINTPSEELRDLLKFTTVPSSGHWAYDEIFLKISRKRYYTLTMLDLGTNFWIGAHVESNINRGVGLQFMQQVKRNNTLKPLSIIKDGGLIFGDLFYKRGYNQIKLGACHVHEKWNANRYIKLFAGLPKESKKPLPPEYLPYRAQFYRIIDSANETEAYIALEAARSAAIRSESKPLLKGVASLEASIPRLLAVQANPWIDTTNNRFEGNHHILEYYPSFKHQMQTQSGCQRVADYRVFRHNFRQFLQARFRITHQYRDYRGYNAQNVCKIEGKGLGSFFQKQFRQINTQYEKYLSFYETFLKII